MLCHQVVFSPSFVPQCPSRPLFLLDPYYWYRRRNKDTDLLKKLALVSYSSLHICSKHLFATVKLHSANYQLASSKKRFVKLLRSKPDVVKYIRKLIYRVGCDVDDDHFLLPILLNFLPRFSRLNSLTIASMGGLEYTGLFPEHQHFFTSCIFLPLITSTSHSAKFPIV